MKKIERLTSKYKINLKFKKINMIFLFVPVLLYILLRNNIFKNRTTPEQLDEAFPKNTIGCYRSKQESLPDISQFSPRKDKSIFFHETSCNSFYKGKITINARQACAVESAAILNPNLDVYLLYSSPGIFKFQGEESDRFLRALLSYDNVNIMHLNFENYARGTPVEKLYESGKLESSEYVVFHASDVVRFTTLWKYGGIYLDTDVIVIKSLSDLPLNYAGIEKNDSVNSAILSFDAEGIGHILAENCLNELKEHFDGKEWATNGPGVITRVLQAACGVDLVEEMPAKECKGFKVYPQNKFYPVPAPSWEMLFDDRYLKQILDQTRDSYVVHFWNDVSAPKKIPVASKNIPYVYFAERFCPKIARAINKFL